MSTDELLGETVILPEYVVEIAELLAETEAHADPFVRAIRKIVIQSAIALHSAHSMSSGSGAPDALPASEATATSEPEPRLSQVDRMAAMGVNAADVREWATGAGIEVAPGGRIRNEVIDAFEAQRSNS